jgi:hypothetical protein
MVVKRSTKKSTSKAAADAYEQTILAEGAPAALDLLGLGSTIGDLIRGKPRKPAKKKRRAKARAKVKMSRTKRTKKAKKKSTRRMSRRRT